MMNIKTTLSSIVMSLLMITPCFAQRELKVVSFNAPESLGETSILNKKLLSGERVMDMEGYDVTDECAFIIIEIPGVKDVNIQPALKCDTINNKYCIFVSKKVKTIYIYSSNYSPLRFQIPFSLQSKTTYKMVVDAPIDIIVVEKEVESKWSIDASIIAGQAVGAEIDFTVSYFLIGIGADWLVGKTKGRTSQTTLFNSGYTGNFLREKNVILDGTRTHLFANVGAYFKYVSVGCQIGVLFCQNTTTNLSYSGNGIGIQDEYIDQNWGTYAHYTLDKEIIDTNKKYFTVAPVVKGYIPCKGKFGLTVGVGYTFIPAVSAGAVWGSVGMQVKFN